MGVTVRRGYSNLDVMMKKIDIIGGGLAGSEAALQLAHRGYSVRLFEMRPFATTGVHQGDDFAELVCSNSLKSTKSDSAAGMLKYELESLGSFLLELAYRHRVPAGGALAVDRKAFSRAVTEAILAQNNITCVRAEVTGITVEGFLEIRGEGQDESHPLGDKADAILVASGPLTSDDLASSLQRITGCEYLSFYDAAAPIVFADSLDRDTVFRQSRYEDDQPGDYLNAPFDKDAYEHFIDELIRAECVIKKEFETRDLFQACQPIEEIARKGFDAPRFGPLKPVGLRDPSTGHRPWAVVQLRAEDAHRQSYNLVGFQTNLTFPEQKRVFRLIPGLAEAEFARYGVMHRNTFLDAPHLLDESLRLKAPLSQPVPPLFVAGQLGGTEGYCEAIASGVVACLGIVAHLCDLPFEPLPSQSAFGALLSYATSSQTQDYQPMHVNFGIMEPLESRIRNKRERYAAYALRGKSAIDAYADRLRQVGLLGDER